MDFGGGVGSAPRASRGVRGGERDREARARAREDGAGRDGEDQGVAEAGVGSMRRGVVNLDESLTGKNGRRLSTRMMERRSVATK